MSMIDVYAPTVYSSTPSKHIISYKIDDNLHKLSLVRLSGM